MKFQEKRAKQVVNSLSRAVEHISIGALFKWVFVYWTLKYDTPIIMYWISVIFSYIAPRNQDNDQVKWNFLQR